MPTTLQKSRMIETGICKFDGYGYHGFGESSMSDQHTSIRLWILALCGMVVAPPVCAREQGEYLGPCDLVASENGKILYVANADAKQIAFLDVLSGKVSRSIGVPGEPTGMALSPDGAKLYVTCAAAQSTVLVMDAASGEVEGTIGIGHTAMGPAVTPDGKQLYVCNRFDNEVSVIDLEANKELTRVPTTREPVAAAVARDGKLVLVANHLPADRADGYDVAAVVTAIDTETHRATTIRLPNGAHGLRGVCVSPHDHFAYLTHSLARYELPAIRVDYGWMNANALSIINTAERKLVNTVLLDDMYLGAANPWGVASTADGKWLCVTHGGTDELSVIDAPALLKKLLAMPVNPGASEVGEVLYDDRNELLDYFRRRRAEMADSKRRSSPDHRPLYTLGDAAGVSNDLTFLTGLRRRIELEGKGPRGLAVVGSKVYVAGHFSDTVSVVDLRAKTGNRVTTMALGAKPRLTVRRRGEMLFHDATRCLEHWQSCASCHPGNRMDGLNWDLTNDGLGNLKNTKSLLLAHSTPPAMSSGVRTSAEVAVRAGINHILFASLPEKEAAAIDVYLKSLKPLSSPYLVNGQLSPAARQGKKLFFSESIGCSKCHPPPCTQTCRCMTWGPKAHGTAARTSTRRLSSKSGGQPHICTTGAIPPSRN